MFHNHKQVTHHLNFVTLLFFVGYTCLSGEPKEEHVIYDYHHETPFLDRQNWSELEELSKKIILCGDEDDDSLLWFAGRTGIWCYDGVQIQEYLYPTSWGDNFPLCIVANNKHSVYVQTDKQLAHLSDGKWNTILENEQTPESRGNSIFELPENQLLVGTNKGVFHLKENQVIDQKYTGWNVCSIIVDHMNRLWVADANTGVVHCATMQSDVLPNQSDFISHFENGKYETGRPILFQKSTNELYCLRNVYGYQLHEFNEIDGIWKSIQFKNIAGVSKTPQWIAEGSNGELIICFLRSLIVYDHNDWHHLSFPKFPIPNTYIFLFQRKSGSLILGGRRHGIYEIDTPQNQWSTFSDLLFQCVDHHDNQWFISSKGTIVYRQKNGKWFQIKEPKMQHAMSVDHSRNGYLWVSGSHEGNAAVFYRTPDGIWHQHTFPELGKRISYLSVWENENSDMLFGCGDEPNESNSKKGGVIIFENKGIHYTHRHLHSGRIPKRVVGITQTGDDYWFGGHSLNRNTSLNRHTIQYLEEFSDNWTDDIISNDSMGLWIAQWGLGVHRFENGNSTTYNKENSDIQSLNIVSLAFDRAKENHVLAGSDKGIFRFDGKSWSSQIIHPQILLNRESGEIKATRANGIWFNQAPRHWYFRDREILEPTSHPNPTGIRTIRYLPESQPPIVTIKKFPTKLQEPGIAHIKWGGLDPWCKTPKAKLEFSFRLNDKEWSKYSSVNETILPDLLPGHYSFTVKARDLAGNVSIRSASIEFQVVPFLWKRPWFIFTVTAAILIIILMIYWNVRSRIRHILEIEEFKLQFFTSISHELRTPLSAILGPIESLLRKTDKSSERHYLGLAQKNAKKMLRLVDELLDFRKAESGKWVIGYQVSDFNQFIRGEITALEPMAAAKNQKIVLVCGEQLENVSFDPKLTEKIFDNLLSNAIKYSPTQSEIKVQTEFLNDSNGGKIKLVVEDKGIGISKDRSSKIFDPFYRVQHSSTDKNTGTGLGLALTQSLVQTLGGTISLTSPIENLRNPRGSRFTVILPVNTGSKSKNKQNHPLKFPVYSNTKEEVIETMDTEIPSVLIVEDNADIRVFLKTELEKKFSVITAQDGKIGRDKALKQIPSVIVTDIMMPNMDGLEMIKSLKANINTAHIPIIALTALKSDRHQLEGLNQGAEDYISKPVDPDILIQKIQNRFLAQQMLWKRFVASKKIDSEESKSIYDTITSEFLRKTIEIIEQRIEDQNLDVEHLAKSLHMSRMTLYRKIKSLSGEPPKLFIRTVRLNKARVLLKETEMNISEISDAVGFNEPSYFASCFKSEFGETPNDYRKS